MPTREIPTELSPSPVTLAHVTPSDSQDDAKQGLKETNEWSHNITIDKTDPHEYLKPFPLTIRYQKGGIGRFYEFRPYTILHSGDEFFVSLLNRRAMKK